MCLFQRLLYTFCLTGAAKVVPLSLEAILRLSAIVLCVAPLLTASAYAQPVIDEPGGPPSNQAPVVQLAREYRSTELIGGVVYNTDDEKLGVINDVIFDAKGRVSAVVLATGGFLGIGQRDVSVLYSSLQLQREGGRIRFVLDTEPEILDQLPAFDTY